MYVDDCQATRPLHCPGAYYLERTLPTIQDIVTQLTNSQSCSELGPIDLPIPCPVMSPCSSGNSKHIAQIVTELVLLFSFAKGAFNFAALHVHVGFLKHSEFIVYKSFHKRRGIGMAKRSATRYCL